MGSRTLHKLLMTAVLKRNKGILQKENPLKPTSLGALHRQVIAYACNAHALMQLHVGFPQSYHHQHHQYEEMQDDHANIYMPPQLDYVQILHDQPHGQEGIVESCHHRHVHRDITQYHHHDHKGIVQHHHRVKEGAGQLHDHDTHRGFVQHHHPRHPHRGTTHYSHHAHTSQHRGTTHYPHHAHIGIICSLRNLCASASQDNDDATNGACNNVNGKASKHRGALAIRLQALCKANPDDREASKALEALVDQITVLDDPEGLLMGAVCLKLASIYASENSPEVSKGLSYAHRAIEAYEPRGPSLKLATCLHMVALIYITMGNFERALLHLEQAALVVKKIKVSPCDVYCVALKHDLQSIMGEACDQFCNAVNFEVQTLLGTAKLHLGRHVEAAAHYQKSIKLKQKLLQRGSPELGAFYLETAEAMKGVKDHKSAKELCLKALKIFLKSYGKGSLEEAKVRILLSKVHFDLGNYEDSLSETKLAKHIWRRFGAIEEVMLLNLSSDRILVNLKRWDEARLRLEEVIQASTSGSKSHTIALILAARVCVLSNNEESAADYSKRALDALEHQQACAQIAGNLVLLSVAYEEKKDYEEAAVFCKKATEMFDQCLDSHAAETAAELEGKTGCLLIHAEKAIEAIPYLERSLSRLKCIPGADLVYVYFYLGLAYPQVQRLEEALEHFEAARIALSLSSEIDATLAVSIYSNLAATYSALNRLDEAIECQKKAVDLVKENNVEDFTLDELESKLESYRKEVEVQKECDEMV